MKKLAAIVAFLVVAVTAMAQSRVGVVGGYTQDGYHAGLTVYQPVGLGFAVQPSLLYNAKGTSWDEIADCKMGYLELPVQFQAGLDLILVRPYIFVEPFVGYALNGSLEYQKVFTGARDLDLKELDSRLEYGLSVGGGLQLGRHLQVSAKYYWNFDKCGIDSYISQVSSSLREERQFSGFAVSAAILF